MSNSNKKREEMLQNLAATAEDLEEATEIIAIVENLLAHKHPNIKFEHMLLWWLICEPAEA